MSITSPNKFCPNSTTLLYPIEKSSSDIEEDGSGINQDEPEGEEKTGLYLVCGDCSYNEKAITFSATHFSKKKEKTQYVHPKRIIADYIYDMTFKRTKSQPCANKDCPSRKKENPEIVLITNEDHPEIAFLCTTCKHIWGKL